MKTEKESDEELEVVGAAVKKPGVGYAGDDGGERGDAGKKCGGKGKSRIMFVRDMEEEVEGCETDFGIVWNERGECGRGGF